MSEIDAYAIIVLPLTKEDGGGYLAVMPDLPGCSSDADTAEGAVANCRSAAVDWIDCAQELGRNIPAPGSAVQKHRRRIDTLLEAISALSKFAADRDAEAKKLSGQLAQFMAILKDENGQLPADYAVIASDKQDPSKVH